MVIIKQISFVEDLYGGDRNIIKCDVFMSFESFTEYKKYRHWLSSLTEKRVLMILEYR